MAKNPQNLPVPVPQAPPMGEVATIARDPFTFPFGGILQPRDETLATRGGGKGIWIYDEIERDGHVYGELSKRKMAVVSREWQVDPASEDARDKAAGDLVKRQFEAMNFDGICEELLDALLKGFAVGEVMWAQDGREVFPSTVHIRDQRRFVFDDEGNLRLLVPGNLMRGEEVPGRKFIVHRFGAKDGNPYGLGLGTRLFWPALFKRQGIKFWLTFCDKFGSPTAVGKYPAGTHKNEQTKLLEALAAIAQDSGIIMQSGMEVELLEAARTGAADTYEALCRYMDEQISAIVLSEAQSARAQGGALAAAAVTRKEVRLELVKKDADLLSETLNSTLVKWIVEFNLPGARPPKVWRDVAEPEDLKARSERDTKIHQMGFKPTLEYIHETYGEGWEDAPEPKPAKPVKPGQDPEAEFTDAPAIFADQAALDRAIAELPAAELDRQALAILKPVMTLIAEAASVEEILERLATVYPSIDTVRLESLLARALYVSDQWGRIAAAGEISAAGDA